MSGLFDPYHKWLGIPAAEQPPHLYRLLGLGLFEADTEVINEAADRLMSYVRMQQNGPYARESQHLLNEISTARLTLTNPARRGPYDAQLRQRVAAQSAPPPVTMPTYGAPQRPVGWGPPGMAPGLPPGMAAPPMLSTYPPGMQPAPQTYIQPAPQPMPQPGPIIVQHAPAGPQIASAASETDGSSVSNRARAGNAWLMPAMIAGFIVLAVGGVYLAGNRGGGSRRLASSGANNPVDAGPGPAVETNGAGVLPTTPVNIKTSGKKLTGPRSLTKTGRPARPAPPAGGTDKVDLLDVIDLAKHAQKGGWSFVEGYLITPPAGLGRLKIPANPPEEYQVSLIAERVSGEGGLNLVLSSGSVQFALLLDARLGRISGLQLVDDRTVMGNATTHDGGVFVNNLPVRVTCTVRKSGVKVRCDEKTIVNFRGDLSRLTMDSDWQEGDKRALYVGSQDASFVISQLLLTPADMLPDETEAELAAPQTPLPSTTPPDDGGPQGRSLADLVGQIQHDPASYGFSSKPVSPDDPLMQQPDQTGQPQPVVSTGPKQPAPPAADLLAARAELRGAIFKAELAAAKKPNEKLALARSLLSRAKDKLTPAPQRFVLFEMTQELAGDAGEVPLAWQAIDAQAAEFEIPFVAAKRDALAAAAKMARSPAELKYVCEAYIYLVHEAVKRDEYDLSIDLADKAVDAARRAKDLPLLGWVQDRTRDLKSLRDAYIPAKKALEVLATSPDDPAASLAYGDFLGLYKRQWWYACEQWVRCQEPVRTVIARAEVVNSTRDPDRLLLADKWWEFGETLSGLPASAARVRAGRWYRSVARPEAADQARITERLAAASLLELGMTKGEWLDVLRLCDVRAHRIQGSWERRGPEVTLRGAGNNDRLNIPLAISGVYEIQVRFTRTSGSGHVCVVLPVGAGQCLFSAGGGGGSTVLEPGGLPVITEDAQKLSNKTAHTLEIRVDSTGNPARVNSELNGQLGARWQGTASSVLPIRAWELQQPGLIGLGSSDNTAITFHSVRLRLISGQVIYSGKWAE